MYDLHLTPEQLEFRDTLRDFVEKEIRPAALHPDRLQPFEKALLGDIVDKASQLGLRTLALSEASGGAGADHLTLSIVMEELASGDVDVAMVLGQTASLGRMLFDRWMTPQQRGRFLPGFMEDEKYHLAWAMHDPVSGLGWSYHRPRADDAPVAPSAVRQSNGDWVINGTIDFVENAPIAKLFAVSAKAGSGLCTLLVPRDTPGLRVRESPNAVGGSGSRGEPVIRWHHGSGAPVVLENCRVPGANLLGKEGENLIDDRDQPITGAPWLSAVNLGIGRAAYEAALDYAKLRRQGGRNIVEHQAVGTILADCAMKLEIARTMIWKAAWALDHRDAVADRSVSDLPLHVVASVFTAEAVHEVTLGSAECFGAMGVMRDMPLQKYVNDGLVFLHSESNDAATKLRIAEAVAGYERPLAMTA